MLLGVCVLGLDCELVALRMVQRMVQRMGDVVCHGGMCSRLEEGYIGFKGTIECLQRLASFQSSNMTQLDHLSTCTMRFIHLSHQTFLRGSGGPALESSSPRVSEKEVLMPASLACAPIRTLPWFNHCTRASLCSCGWSECVLAVAIKICMRGGMKHSGHRRWST
jgi:hypothetical protein